MDRVDCTVFEDQLDSLVRGALPEAGVVQLQGHASVCADCAALLHMQEHLVTPSLAELEASVPDAYVASMWYQVQGALDAPRAGVRRRVGRVMPLLAAATVALLFANGLALRALFRAESQAQDLAGQVLDQQRRLVALQVAEASGLRGARAGLGARGGALRALEERTDLTVADLRELLGSLPADTPIIGAARARQLTRSRLVPAAWRDAMTRLDTGVEVTAGALLTVLDDLDISGDVPVPAARLFELLT
jgi:hypothetical protein